MKLKFIGLAVVAIGLALGQPVSGATYRGLFVGVNEYDDPELETLYGCDWDAVRLRDAFTAGGYCADADAGLVINRSAKKDEVRARFRGLAAAAVPGDTVVYFQSSHGGYYVDEHGGSTKDAYLCLADTEYRDAEFAEDLALFAEGVRVVVILDACHSAGMYKSAVRSHAAWGFARRVNQLLAERRAATWASRAKGARGTGSAAVAWITAADWYETSEETGRNGNFTRALLDGWEDASADGDDDAAVSFGELAKYAEAHVESSHVQAENTDLLDEIPAGQAFDVTSFRLLAGDGVLGGFLGSCPAEVVIPAGTTNIAFSAFDARFNDVSALESVTIPASVSTIGAYAFLQCRKLEAVIFKGDMEEISIGEDAFKGTPWNRPLELLVNDDGCLYGFVGALPSALDIPSTVNGIEVTSIGESAFDADENVVSSLKSVAFPASVTNIGAWAFYSCENLTNVAFSTGLESIGKEAFLMCVSLDLVIIPTNVTDIGIRAFAGCGNLRVACVPESLEDIVEDRSVFLGCDKDLAVTYYDGILAFDMTFDAGDGENAMVETLAYGAELAAPPVAREGYTFLGWEPEVPATVPISNATYVAQWRVNSYTVTYNANGGMGGTAQTLAYGTELAAPAVAREGYTFLGWKPEVPATVPARNATYVAQWRPNTYTVTYNANGGTLPKGKGMPVQTMTYDCSVHLTKNAFTRKNYVFLGWATSPADAKNGVVALKDAAGVVNLSSSGNVMLYAVWAKKNYKVAFYGTYKGVTGVMAAQTFTYGKAGKLSKNKFARKGWKFKGWAKSKALAKKGKIAYKNKAKVKNLVITGKTVKLYAVWRKK